MDSVNHPKHYTYGRIEVIEIIEQSLTPEEYRGYIKGNVIKYITRERRKGGLEDIRKALWYLNRLVEKHAMTIDDIMNLAEIPKKQDGVPMCPGGVMEVHPPIRCATQKE